MLPSATFNGTFSLDGMSFSACMYAVLLTLPFHRCVFQVQHKHVCACLCFHHRSFQQLSTLMTEERNCALYQREINQHLKNKIPLVPYLGFFLTQIVHLTCHQHLWENSWLALTAKNDLTCSIELDSDLKCTIESQDDPHGCETGNGCDCQTAQENGLTLTGYSPLVPSYSLHVSCFMPRYQYHSSSLNLVSDTTPLYLPSSPICMGSKSRTRSTPTSDEEVQFCRLEDAALYHHHYLNHESASYSMACSQDCKSGISILEPNTADSDQDDEQFCKLEDSERYRNRESFHEDENSVAGIDGDRNQADTSMASAPTLAASVHSEIDGSSPSKHLSIIGFTDVCSAHSTRQPFFHQKAKLKCSHAIQVDSVNPKYHRSPTALLCRYQTASVLCANNIQSREEIRNLIMNYLSNTEMENYMLSYKWEPH